MELNLRAMAAYECGKCRGGIERRCIALFCCGVILAVLGVPNSRSVEPTEKAPQRRAYAPSSFAVILERVEVSPGQLTVLPGGTGQIVVTAHFSDGSIRNVTRFARFETRAEGVVTISALGRLVAQTPGHTAIVCSFQGQEHVIEIRVPTPEDVPPYRKPRHSSDDDENIVGVSPNRCAILNRRLAA